MGFLSKKFCELFNNKYCKNYKNNVDNVKNFLKFNISCDDISDRFESKIICSFVGSGRQGLISPMGLYFIYSPMFIFKLLWTE